MTRFPPGLRFWQRPAGQLGNQLFQLHFVRQIGHQLQVGYNYPSFREAASFPRTDDRQTPNRMIPKSRRYLREEIDPRDSNRALSSFIETLESGRSIALPSGLLGNYLFEYGFENSAEIMGWTPQPRFEAPVIGVHFRGTDFHSWDASAVLAAPYYLSAISWCLDQQPGARIRIFSDDFDLPSLHTVQEEFRQHIEEDSASEDALTDLRSLSRSWFIVSSPSTFSIWAGILSQGARIVHSKNWVERKTEAGEYFWTRVLEGGSRVYPISHLA